MHMSVTMTLLQASAAYRETAMELVYWERWGTMMMIMMMRRSRFFHRCCSRPSSEACRDFSPWEAANSMKEAESMELQVSLGFLYFNVE